MSLQLDAKDPSDAGTSAIEVLPLLDESSCVAGACGCPRGPSRENVKRFTSAQLSLNVNRFNCSVHAQDDGDKKVSDRADDSRKNKSAPPRDILVNRDTNRVTVSMQLLKTTFAQIITEHQGIINAICAIYYSDPEDQKDARQDILVQIWKALPSFRNESKVSTWIYSVALNTVLARIRKDSRDIMHEPRRAMQENHLIVSPFADDLQQQLKMIINDLGAAEKALIVLYLEGYSYKEISAMLNITETNVSTKMNRIKDKLRQMFKPKEREHR